MNRALCSTRGKTGDSATRDGDKHSSKKIGIVDGMGLTGLRDRAFELMMLHLELFAPMFGSQSAVAPRFPTAFDFFASLP
jgi:hypothetical protein